jgi:hypothetical protein
MSRANWGENPDPRLDTYLKVIDSLSRGLRLRVKASTPRTWAQFWRIVAEEQVVQRHHVMRLQPPFLGHVGRAGDWFTPERQAAHEEARAKMDAIRASQDRPSRATQNRASARAKKQEPPLGS